MKVLTSLFDWMDATLGTRGVPGPTHVTHDHCPHCDARTPWRVNVLQRFYRCMQCGRDPMGRAEDRSPVARDRVSEETAHRVPA